MRWRLKCNDREEKVVYADTSEKCLRVLRQLEAATVVGVDTEVTGVDLGKTSPVGKVKVISIQFAADDSPPVFVPLWDGNEGLLKIFKPWLESERRQKVYHNAKFDMHALMCHGVRARGLLGDTLVMDFMFDTGQLLHGLKECCRRYFGENLAVDYSDEFRVPILRKDGTPGSRTRVQGVEEVIQTSAGRRQLVKYATKDPMFTVRLYNYLKDKLSKVQWYKEHSYLECYETFDLSFTDVLFEIEQRGCLLDQGHLERMGEEIEEDRVAVEEEFLRSAVGFGVPQSFMVSFNMKSSQQIGRLLEQHLGLRIPDRTPTGQPKVDADTLSRLRATGEERRILNLLLEMRRLTKLHSTYVEPLVFSAENYKGRVHTNFKQAEVATMRLSSSLPNLQNIPTARKDHYGIRRAFIAPKGMVIGDIDLAQIEIRLMAHHSRDPVMIKAINDGWDLHALTACRSEARVVRWLSENNLTPNAKVLKQVKELFPNERDDAKTLNFSIGYGMGPQTYALRTGRTEREAKESINEFFSLYSGLYQYIRQVRNNCYRDGYVRTILGRYLRVPMIRSQVQSQRKYGERQAFNYHIQGGAADLLKMSMLLVHRDDRLRKLGVRMVLQVHDELLLEIPKGAEKEVGPIIEDYVSHPYRYFGMKDLRVDTPADLGTGKSWQEAKK